MPAVAAGDLCEITVLVSGDREKAESVATDSETVEHALMYEEFHDGVASDAYDAVYVVTPNARHLEYAETAAELGRRFSVRNRWRPPSNAQSGWSRCAKSTRRR